MTTISVNPTTDEQRAVALAGRQADSLRRLADMIEANPHLADDFGYTLRTTSVPLIDDGQKSMLAAYTRAATRAGATIKKRSYGAGEGRFGIEATLGEIVLQVWADREQVCERVVTGTREVTEEVPDPEALAAVPTTTVTRTEEIVEWQCKPLLDGAA